MTDAKTVIVTEYFRCINSEDWTAFADIWADDAILHAVGAKPRYGRHDVIAYFPRIFSVWAEHLDSPTRMLATADTVTVEVSFVGRTHTGAEATFDALDLFDIADGRITRLSNWYDISAARRAVGVADHA